MKVPPSPHAHGSFDIGSIPKKPPAASVRRRPTAKKLKMPPGCVDVTAEKLGTGHALVGTETYRRRG